MLDLIIRIYRRDEHEDRLVGCVEHPDSCAQWPFHNKIELSGILQKLKFGDSPTPASVD